MAVKIGVGLNQLMGKNTMYQLTKGVKKIVPLFPLWSNQIKPSKKTTTSKKMVLGAEVVYMPTCISRMMGGSSGHQKNIIDTIAEMFTKAGVKFIIPQQLNTLCCGQIFSSKGYHDAYKFSTNQTVEFLWEASQQGKLAIVLDVSSCTQTLQSSRKVLTISNQQNFDALNIIDSIDYISDYILPRVKILKKKNNIVLHPVCSLKKMGLQNKFEKVAKAFAQQVTIPFNANCRGMEGDRGFLFPELTQSATRLKAQEVNALGNYDGYFSSGKTCEIAISDAVGKNYESIVYLVNECI